MAKNKSYGIDEKWSHEPLVDLIGFGSSRSTGANNTNDIPISNLIGIFFVLRKSVLTKAGIDCKTVLKTSAEYDAFVEIWVDHLEVMLAHF